MGQLKAIITDTPIEDMATPEWIYQAGVISEAIKVFEALGYPHMASMLEGFLELIENDISD